MWPPRQRASVSRCYGLPRRNFGIGETVLSASSNTTTTTGTITGAGGAAAGMTGATMILTGRNARPRSIIRARRQPPDARLYVHRAGIPTVVFGPGDVADAHSD